MQCLVSADIEHKTTIRPPPPASTSTKQLLFGKTIAIKDNISVAGLPLTGGTQPYHLSLSSPYPISQIDAPVVTRVLDAGATIIGTSTCENYCMSGLSFTSATGPVDNPWIAPRNGERGKGYSAGGSSSGSAALVAVTSIRQWRAKNGLDMEKEDGLGEGADFALGADQGGSIRLVRSSCVLSLAFFPVLSLTSSVSSPQVTPAYTASNQHTASCLIQAAAPYPP